MPDPTAVRPLPANVVRHWCGKADRHPPHIGCNGFGQDAGPVAGCDRTDGHPAHRACDGKGKTA